LLFDSGSINLHSYQQCRSVPFPLHSGQRLVLFVLLMVAILTGVRWALSVNLAKDVKHFFISLLAIFTSFENCLFSSFTHLFGGLLML
jgi:hypothetical protein